MIEQLFRQVPVRVDETDSVSSFSQLEDEVPQKGCLTRTGLPDHVRMLSQFGQPKSKWRFAAPLMPFSNVKNVLVHTPESAATPGPTALARFVIEQGSSWTVDRQTFVWIEPVG